MKAIQNTIENPQTIFELPNSNSYILLSPLPNSRKRTINRNPLCRMLINSPINETQVFYPPTSPNRNSCTNSTQTFDAGRWSEKGRKEVKTLLGARKTRQTSERDEMATLPKGECALQIAATNRQLPFLHLKYFITDSRRRTILFKMTFFIYFVFPSLEYLFIRCFWEWMHFSRVKRHWNGISP